MTEAAQTPDSKETAATTAARRAVRADRLYAAQAALFPLAATYAVAAVPLFPLAATYAVAAVPLSVHGLTGGVPLFEGLATPSGHAHEMLFGFALAVVAGFTINRARALSLALLVSLWIVARVAFLLAPGGILAPCANAGFALLMAGLAAPQFLRGAKKWRNRAVAPILLLIAIMVPMFHATRSVLQGAWQRLAVLEVIVALSVLEVIVALSALMLFMGGRLLAPAAAGAQRRLGHELEARVQPRLEAALLLLAGLAVIALPVPGADSIAGAALLAAAVVAGARLVRWRLWRCPGHHDLLLLGVGHAWLVVGLALLGSALLGGHPPLTSALHAITVGALGTMTITVMARARRVRLRRATDRLPGIGIAVTLVGAAAVLRIGVPAAWQLAAALWSIAYLLLLVHLLWLDLAGR